MRVPALDCFSIHNVTPSGVEDTLEPAFLVLTPLSLFARQVQPEKTKLESQPLNPR